MDQQKLKQNRAFADHYDYKFLSPISSFRVCVAMARSKLCIVPSKPVIPSSFVGELPLRLTNLIWQSLEIVEQLVKATSFESQ